jgi:16S rRNA (guanine527-N7)-methyltransferase
VAPCTPAQFASRHVLESLAALPFLTSGAAFIDLGSGAGLPAIPCLVMRPGLSATLIEASRKKAVFLREAAARLNLSQRVEVVAERFEKVEPPAADALTCRAIERFAEILPAMAAWAIAVPRLLLFGGASVGESIERANLSCERILLTGSEQRFLFVVNRAEANPER